jgi:hypothetical protein
LQLSHNWAFLSQTQQGFSPKNGQLFGFRVAHAPVNVWYGYVRWHSVKARLFLTKLCRQGKIPLFTSQLINKH